MISKCKNASALYFGISKPLVKLFISGFPFNNYNTMNLSPIMKNYVAGLSFDTVFEDTSGCISGLKHVPAGEIWELEDINERKQRLLYKGREWAVVDNLVVHEEIKTGGSEAQRYIDNYKRTLTNLAASGIKVVCYNFMPVFFKVRTHFNYSFQDKHAFSLFDPVAFAVFDIYILRRPLAEKSYSGYQKHQAKIFNTRLSTADKLQLAENILEGVQSTMVLSLNGLTEKVNRYAGLGNEELIYNMENFNRQILPLAGELGISMHFQIDDPCGNLLGLPCASEKYLPY